MALGGVSHCVAVYIAQYVNIFEFVFHFVDKIFEDIEILYGRVRRSIQTGDEKGPGFWLFYTSRLSFSKSSRLLKSMELRRFYFYHV